jgi:hypothetical protein
MCRGSRYTDALGFIEIGLLSSGVPNRGREAMANWSLCGRHTGPGKPPTPIFINLDNVLTLERITP